MKKILLITFGYILAMPLMVFAATTVPWQQVNLTDNFIKPALVNGSAQGIVVSASSTFVGVFTNSNSSASSTFTGGFNARALNLTGSATSTAANGFNLSAGCFAVNGACITGGGGSSASTTLLSDNNTFSGTNSFTGPLTMVNATSSTFAITTLVSKLLSTNANGSIVATTSIGTNFLTGTLGTINSTSLSVGGSITITAASSTLLANNNTFSGLNAFTNSGTTTFSNGLNISAGCFSIAGACLTAGSIGGGSTEAVNWATVAVLAGTPTYANGTAGAGATLTEVGTGALSVDGNNPALNDRVLVKNQASAFQNGIYSVTVTGSGIASYILTRATDYNTPTEITPGINTYVLSGSANANTTWAVSYTPPLVIGTNNLNYSESAGTGGTVTSVNNGSTGATLTFTNGPVTTNGTINGEINLAHANIWSALQLFSNTGTTTFSGGIESGTKIAAAYFNATSSSATSTFNGGIKAPCFSTDGITCLSAGSGTVGSGTTGQLPYYAAPGTALTASSSIFLTSSGAVGVGTTLPQAVNTNSILTAAHIGATTIAASTTDNTSSSASIFDAYAPGARTFIGAHGTNQIVSRYGLVLGGWGEIGVFNSSFGTANGLAIGTQPAIPLVLGTNNVERLRINSSGNFGIGTTTPTGKFVIQLNSGDTAYPGNNAFTIASSTNLATTTLLNLTNTGKLLLGAASPFIQIGGTSSSFPGLTNNSNQLFIRKADDSAFADVNAANIFASNNFQTGATGLMAWTSAASTPQGTIDTNLARQSAGVLEFGTSAANALGGFIAASSTINAGLFTANGGASTTVFTASSNIYNLGLSANQLIATDANKKEVSTSSVGFNFIAGTVPVAQGGTGVTSLTADSILYTNHAGTGFLFSATSTFQACSSLCNFTGNASTTNFTSSQSLFVGTNQVSGQRYLSFKLASSTAWTATSSATSLYGDTVQMYAPFTGLISSIACGTNAGTLEIEATDGSSHTYLAASTTANYNTFSLSFTKGDLLVFQAGNPATSPTYSACTAIATGF